MKKTLLLITVGFALALACTIAGLASLSATVITVTVYFAVPAFIVVALDALKRKRICE